MGFYRDQGVTQITIHNDRPAHITRPDPVAARDGVFATLTPDELSPTEATRHGTATAGARTPAPQNTKIWTPTQILKHITKLYDKFKKPK